MRAAAVRCILRLLLAWLCTDNLLLTRPLYLESSRSFRINHFLLSCEAHAVLRDFRDYVRHIMALYSIGIVVLDLLIAHGLSLPHQTRVGVRIVLARLLPLVHQGQIAVVHVGDPGGTADVLLALTCHQGLRMVGILV